MKSCIVEITGLDQIHDTIIQTSERSERSGKGQFLTPTAIAQFMAGLFEQNCQNVRILDAGAGAGVLFSSCIQALISGNNKPKTIEVVAYENDKKLKPYLNNSINHCRIACTKADIEFHGEIRVEDFIKSGISLSEENLFRLEKLFTHVILNPPYKKINGQSKTRTLLDASGLNVSNLYAAFVWIAANMLEKGGELVFITPRSFCNGPYYRKFRKSLLNTMAIQRIHIFNSRNKAFSNDKVLQENVIIHAIRKEEKPNKVTISSSEGLDFHKINIKHVPYENVVLPNDSDAYIHLVTDDKDEDVIQKMKRFRTSLHELGIDVSTGRVVDFRATQYLQMNPAKDSVPLIYPCHFKDGFISWPLETNKKPNAIMSSEKTCALIVPSGYYVLTKRFSTKEEQKRIVAAVFNPKRIRYPSVAFENHLNYFHAKHRGMSLKLAKGLLLYLNSSLFDNYFRLFSGHTQVNASDLRKMFYPTYEQLLQLSTYVKDCIPEQDVINSILGKVCEYND